MTRACFKYVAATVCLAAVLLPGTARAALMYDPQRLYEQMQAAYRRGAAHGWRFRDQEYYLSTIFAAGRAYALQRPNDPNYGQLCRLTVRMATALHYDPLTNHEAVPWYVREAALYVIKNPADAAEETNAKALLARVNAEDHPARLARFAARDAAANLLAYPRHAVPLLDRVEADWRAWLITKDPSWRALAIEHADETYFPIGNLPTTWGPQFASVLKNAAHGAEGYTQAEQTEARTVLAHLKEVDPLMIIGSVKAVPHDVYMTTLAPADEYFGPLGMSVIGIPNELKLVNEYLNVGWGNRESGLAVQVAASIDDLHRVYPKDRALPRLLYACYTTLERLTTPAARAAATHMRSILTIEYQDSPQARRVLGEAE